MNNTDLSPEQLMRSRYDAFVREDWEYVANTSVNQKFVQLQDSTPLKWLKLDVIDSYDNIVEFKAYYIEDSRIEVMHEKSTFVKENGVWKYLNGILFNSKVERNESCPCGSGKKFKKCCA